MEKYLQKSVGTRKLSAKFNSQEFECLLENCLIRPSKVCFRFHIFESFCCSELNLGERNRTKKSE